MLLFVLTFSLVISLGHAACPLADTLTHVQDNAGVIDAASKQRMQNKLLRLRDSGVADIAVVTMPTLNGLVAKDAATTMLNDCKLGTAEKDNGLLILLVMDSREWAIETGYGLEGTIPDILTHRIATQRMVPLFKQGYFGAGLAVGLYAIDSLLKNNISTNQNHVPVESKHLAIKELIPSVIPQSPSKGMVISTFILILFMLPFLYYTIWLQNRHIKKLKGYYLRNNLKETILLLQKVQLNNKGVTSACCWYPLWFITTAFILMALSMYQSQFTAPLLVMPAAIYLISKIFQFHNKRLLKHIMRSPRADGKAIRLFELPPETDAQDLRLHKKGAIEIMAWNNDGKLEYIHLPGPKHALFKYCNTCKKQCLEFNRTDTFTSEQVYSCLLCGKEEREKNSQSSSSSSDSSSFGSSSSESSSSESSSSDHSSRDGSSGGGGSSGKW